MDDGLFNVAYELREQNTLLEATRARIDGHLRWFRENLAVPKRFNRTKSKGYYRRTAKGISWFRDTAEAQLFRMHELKDIVEAHGYVVSIIQEERIGYIVYEDEHQVVAEPFADTRTSS